MLDAYALFTSTGLILLCRYAYQAGVMTGISAPSSRGFLSGLSTVFATGAGHKLEKGAVVQEIVALHVKIGHSSSPSVSTQIAALRKLLGGGAMGELGARFREVAKVSANSYIVSGNA
jgi:hypothetical protein